MNEIEAYLSQLNNKINKDIGIKIMEQKNHAASEGDESRANYLWCLYQVFLVQKNYTDAFWNMKNKKYEEAWLQLDRADIELSFLEEHYDKYFGGPIGLRFQLMYILNAIKRLQTLFPYKLFLSRESIIKREKCSICGETIKLRGGCGHKLGQLYNGEQCCHEVTEFELIGMALVKDPFDKYTYLKIEGQDYNYQIIDFLMEHLQTPYELWGVEKVKIKAPNYTNIGSNNLCSCGSGKKYKKCCRGTNNEMMDHFIFDFPQNDGINIEISSIS